jgi:hypothetical protein
MARTLFPIVAVLALGVALLMMQGSGFNALITGSQDPGPLGDAIGNQADSSPANEGSLNATRSAAGEGSIAGLILGGGETALDVVGLLALLPVTLERLGFPTWFALPLGSIVYIISGLGIAQFVSGRVFR